MHHPSKFFSFSSRHQPTPEEGIHFSTLFFILLTDPSTLLYSDYFYSDYFYSKVRWGVGGKAQKPPPFMQFRHWHFVHDIKVIKRSYCKNFILIGWLDATNFRSCLFYLVQGFLFWNLISVSWIRNPLVLFSSRFSSGSNGIPSSLASLHHQRRERDLHDDRCHSG